MAFSAEQHSDYFRRALFAVTQRGADLALLNVLVADSVDETAILELLQHFQAAQEVPVALRRTRQLVFMALMERDLTGAASLDEVCHAMTTLAHLVTNSALRYCAADLIEDFGTPRDHDGQPIDLIAVAMGKGGANELNVSSDLDLIFLIRDQGSTDGLNASGGESRRGPLSATEFAQHLARRAIGVLSDNSADGFVFRIDTRLRPNGDSGPLVVTLPALEEYLQVQGREWERFAWLKAQVCASSAMADASSLQADTKALFEIVEPFVYRRYHDYQVFGALREVHELIRNEARKRDARRAGGVDVKLGRGGIREIEFIAQLFQIVRGGRDRGLRDRATLTTLTALGERGLLEPDVVPALRDAYQWLRRCEHMLQYRDDQQTHFLPLQDQTISAVAAMMGSQADAFMQTLNGHLEFVEQVFDALLKVPVAPDGSAAASEQETGPSGADAPDDEEQQLIGRHVDSLRNGARYRSAQPSAQQAIDNLLSQAAQRGASAKSTVRLIQLLESICRRPAYLALLAQYPVAFERVLVLLDASEWASHYLAQHPLLLDELIDGDLLAPTDLADWQANLAREMQVLSGDDGEGADVERQMDIAREWQHAQLFRILARELIGQVSIQIVADELSELADRTLQVAIDTVWQTLPARFCKHPKFAAIAYGRLGGKELGYASDLDLVFVFDDDDKQAAHTYALLTRRLTTWLSAQTSAGQLFDVDLRLRPNGEAGLLVSSLTGFADYQRQSAWVWEHQALTRARFCAGDPKVGQQFETLRRELLSQARDNQHLRQEIIAMRQRMHDGHPNKTTLFDLKHDSGGMVDIEFLVQYLILSTAHQYADMMDNIGNIALLKRAASLELIDADQANLVANAYRTYRKMQHGLRLQGATYARVAPATVQMERAAVQALWQTQFANAASQ